ncbi:protein adenylyltransferase SelO-like isoform X1 [Schistocerca gregaria]|uniref:protein adenylyltransferase SelO-like isoform X1 n=2 Tax=Schistocerca gregaria TaxID=7010 RepID=UPI00211EF449|nr:protein adenylyltransferase SelO-like isoform X1 [Schistocerca gregaria]
MNVFRETVRSTLKRSLSEWSFSPSTLSQLPLDETTENYIRRNIRGALFSQVLPTPMETEVKLVAYSRDVLTQILDMDPEITETQDFVDFVAGNKILDSSVTLAHRYGGHQFGVWNGQLGDGRVILLGEYLNSLGQRWELQLKGAGKTPYSRDDDGRAVLRSSIREFLCSEAMFYLGIPTCRTAAIVASQDLVMRDEFYKGTPKAERAAVVLRVAPSWFRFGSLELLAKNGELTTLRILLEYIVQEHFTRLKDAKNKYVLLFSEIMHKTVDLVVQWHAVGFAHGVLNTDNMSLLSITIDYGPFGFVEAYDSQFVPNTSDKNKRYAFDKQLEIVAWNLEKLAYALFAIVTEYERRQILDLLNQLSAYANHRVGCVFAKKLGLRRYDDSDNDLLMLLLQMMEETGADFTMTFRQFGEIELADMTDPTKLANLWSLQRLSSHNAYERFVELYKRRVSLDYGLTEDMRRDTIMRTNPRYVLRNWMAQAAIEKAEQDDYSEVRVLHEILKMPFTTQEAAEIRNYADPPPPSSYYIKVSCSS